MMWVIGRFLCEVWMLLSPNHINGPPFIETVRLRASLPAIARIRNIARRRPRSVRRD
ncbi:hypothetical protein CUJ84_Chr002291 [Rhizobium leguminosarum]|uniref:Uncharacterized protein n=1 Tax=Rhizobium leguminosarum TaxID=384 RepID=A0A2K9Z3H4_RHILE|nr:hypothetical protein CUJ84_Chr002291 [Rhizobium leguminosarum]